MQFDSYLNWELILEEKTPVHLENKSFHLELSCTVYDSIPGMASSAHQFTVTKLKMNEVLFQKLHTEDRSMPPGDFGRHGWKCANDGHEK